MTGCHDTTASASRDVRTANASQIRATQYFSRITITMGSFEVLESGEGGIKTLRMTCPFLGTLTRFAGKS